MFNKIANNESQMQNINLKKESVIVNVKLWNNKEVIIEFKDYLGVMDKNSIGYEIGDIITSRNSTFKEAIVQNIIDGGGDESELNDYNSIKIYDAWNEMIILEVIAKYIMVYEETDCVF